VQRTGVGRNPKIKALKGRNRLAQNVKYIYKLAILIVCIIKKLTLNPSLEKRGTFEHHKRWL